jgi:hypothetical protein
LGSPPRARIVFARATTDQQVPALRRAGLAVAALSAAAFVAPVWFWSHFLNI